MKHMLACSLLVLVLAVGGAQAAVLTVDAGGGADYTTIQAAIDAAAPGDQITVAAGHYVEQLHIATADLTITGAGVGVTFVDSPAVLTASFFNGTYTYKPVVFVDGVEGTAMADLTMDGLGQGNANNRFLGLGLFNAGGTFADMRITGMRDTPLSGVQHGLGVYAFCDDAAPRTLTLTDVAIDDAQKNAATFSGEGLFVDATRLDVTGNGPLGVGLPAQNGIQFSGGASGSLDDCDIADYNYTGPDWTACGLLLFGPSSLDVSGGTIARCRTSIYLIDGSATIDGITVTEPVYDPMYAYNASAKAAGGRAPQAQGFDVGTVAPDKAAATVVLTNSTFTGTNTVDMWGPTAWAGDALDFTVTGCTIENFDYGLCLYEDGGVITGSASGNDLSGNMTYGAWSNTAAPFDCRGNDWGSASGPAHASNPGGTGDAVSDNILFTPWTGRTATVVADLTATPNGAFYWEDMYAIGVDGDAAPGFGSGSFRAPSALTRYGFDPSAVFGRPVAVGELYDISYHTKKATLHSVDVGDWYFIMYTVPYDGSPGATWYGNRINTEPYFSAGLNETAGAWNRWQSLDGQDNRLRFYDSSSGYYGSYTDGFLADMAADPAYASQPLMIMALSVGSAWAPGFDGQLDGLTIELVSGETVRLNFESGNAGASVATTTTGPLACGDALTYTFSLDVGADMPDVFLYNAVVRASSELSFGAVTDLEPFGDVNNNFFTYDNGDGSYTIVGSTVANPTSPIVGPTSAPLFSIGFTAAAEGTGTISFDSLVLRDPANNPIPSTTGTASIVIDCTAPAPVTGITAAPGHNKVDVSWTHDGNDVDHYEVFAGVWHDGTGVSAYPEYDDLPGDVIPARPGSFANAVASAEWVDVGPAAGTSLTQTWADHLSRGVYYYEVFAVDAAGNASPAAPANDRSTNYWLGDVWGVGSDPVPNGLVESFDMNELGSYFFTTVAIGSPGAVVDVGPTDDWSRLGIPLTDSRIDFEDLMVFSMNFGVVSAAKDRAPASDRVVLAWVDYGDGRYGLRLVEGASLKGLLVTAPRAVDGVEAGQLLDAQSEPTFLRNGGATLNTAVAVMGVNVPFAGTGDLLVVQADEAIDVADLVIIARGTDNSALTVSLDKTSDVATPRVFALYPNYPNPFNPMTKISFSLPEAQNVKLTVYSVDGRRVATLVNENRPAGLHEVLWQGRDDAGRQAASGVYFCRIEAGPYSSVQKMTLTK
ncbi:MAG TPA: FlgD immunoglobulin-like domain containing protein [Candidatus Krumholzibacteria bacterium]|nr:FlgD immunoglobulin-like domain containing protein [Candidatus Krumholzibacteria bacterium]